MAPATTSAPAPRARRRSPGWVPDQHGAWFMVTVPAITGVVLAPSWTATPLLLTWWLGYFTFFAASVWIRSRFRDRHRPPVVVYGSLAAVAGLATLALDWRLLAWVPAFAPLVAVAVFEAWRRRPRSLASGISTVAAACLILPVVAGAGGGLDARAWAAFATYLAFFVGTVPYVKTLIRERGSKPWFIGSVAYHVVMLVAAALAVRISDGDPFHPLTIAAAAVLLARATLMPITGARRDRPWTPKTVGLLDAVMTALVVVVVLL
ncbi:YwiC-like family protein [uncultured Corynebacterium sp.]|uniref:YwiC-like family protein n=1 Tax=uncultured Corynebacterium sp. TaxID=159447 RepID=UPI0025EB4A3E|nr:YwiC-like family protein [uncultured Corynebacterium sp.]